MPELPSTVDPLPQVRRSEGVRQVVEVTPIHDGLLEHPAGPWKFTRWDAEVTEDLLGEPLRKLMIEATDEGHALLAGDVPRADLLGSVIGGPPDPELGAGRVVVEVIDAVVDAVVLAVSARRALG
jgi:hypothetical protein